MRDDGAAASGKRALRGQVKAWVGLALDSCPSRIISVSTLTLGVGQLGSERVAQSVPERTAGAFGVDAGLSDGTQDPVLPCAARNSVSVGANE